MALKFDEYYSIACKNRKQQSIGDSSSSHGCGGKALEKSAIFSTHMSRRWNPKTIEWTLWTLRGDPLLTKMCCPGLTSGSSDRICFRQTKAEFLEILYRTSNYLCMEFGRISSTQAIVLKSKRSPVYTSDNIFSYGESFVYSALSDIIIIDALEIGFDGKKEDVAPRPGVVKLRAGGGLAHILATCIKPEDVFVIVGRNMTFDRDEYEISLNVISEGNDGSEPLTLIRLAFDVSDTNVRFMEKIRPHENPSFFAFKYACRDMASRYSHELVKYRHFSLIDGSDPAEDLFEMPLQRGIVLKQICDKLLANQYTWNSRGGINDRGQSSSPDSIGYYTAPLSSSSSDLEMSPRVPSRKAVFSHKQVPCAECDERFSTDEEEYSSFQRSSFSRSRGSRNGRGRASFWVTLLRICMCIICPLIVLIVCAILFKPVQPMCSCYPRDIPSVSPMMDDYDPYHNNYEDVQVLHDHYEF